MEIWQRSYKFSYKLLIILASIVLLTFTTACSSNTAQLQPNPNQPTIGQTTPYSAIERGNSPQGQDFGQWVVGASKGLIQDAYVRDNNKLGVVLSSQVRPNEVRDLTKSLVQGFRKNFPQQDFTVLVYAPDKKLILTAQYDLQGNRIQYS